MGIAIIRHICSFYNHKSTNVKMHPRCPFCLIPYFSSDELLVHLTTSQHRLCKYCKGKWYKSEIKIRKHYADKHYICTHEDCQDKMSEFVSFRDVLSLRSHILAHHVDSGSLNAAQRRKLAQIDLHELSNLSGVRISDLPARELEFDKRRNRWQKAEKQVLNDVGSFDFQARIHHTQTCHSLRTLIECIWLTSIRITIFPFFQLQRQSRNKDRQQHSWSRVNHKNSNSSQNTQSSSERPVRSFPEIIPAVQLAARNQLLIEGLRCALPDEANFNQFKQVSADYRNKSISAESYLEQFNTMIAESISVQEREDLLFDLLALLPDHSLKQSLYDAWKRGQSGPKWAKVAKQRVKPKPTPVEENPKVQLTTLSSRRTVQFPQQKEENEIAFRSKHLLPTHGTAPKQTRRRAEFELQQRWIWQIEIRGKTQTASRSRRERRAIQNWERAKSRGLQAARASGRGRAAAKMAWTSDLQAQAQ